MLVVHSGEEVALFFNDYGPLLLLFGLFIARKLFASQRIQFGNEVRLSGSFVLHASSEIYLGPTERVLSAASTIRLERGILFLLDID